MADYTSKVDLLFRIRELKENGDIDVAMRLQRVFLDSIKTDQSSGHYSLQIELDRKSKKTISAAGVSVSTELKKKK